MFQPKDFATIFHVVAIWFTLHFLCHLSSGKWIIAICL